MIHKRLILGLLSCCLLAMIWSQCSELKDDLPTQPAGKNLEAHPTGWTEVTSNEFHGQFLEEDNWDLEQCKKCHGDDYSGGTSKSSCSSQSCHSGSPETCTTCHGGVDNQTGAPPKDLENNIARTFKGVGAHTVHNGSSKWGCLSFTCQDCHKKPTELHAAGHVDSELPAELVWGEMAKKDNLSPNFQGTTCANVYCHGASLKGGALVQPNWIQTDSLNCNSCHGLPPNSGAHEAHVTNLALDCNICHEGYEKNSKFNEDYHLDGKRDVILNESVGGSYANGTCSNVSCHGSGNSPEWNSQGGALTCVSCHGGTDNQTGAPPADLAGNINISAKGVGAHSAHVSNPQWNEPMDCEECHQTPTQVSDAGHTDSNLPAEIVWGQLAQAGGLSPDWNGSSCSNIYCHGTTLTGGKSVTPEWTQSTALTCDGCHGGPPDTGAHREHTEDAGLDCNICHDGYQQNIATNTALHIDTKVDVQLSAEVGGSYSNGVCSNVSCHGTGNAPQWDEDVEMTCVSCHGGVDNNTGAPPKDLAGNVDQSAVGVGAHTAHVESAQWMQSMDCNECHITPVGINDALHIDYDQKAELNWGMLATTGGLTPDWDGQNCANIYCHGTSLTGGTNTTPSWNQSGAVTCNACHGQPPTSGAHTVHTDTYSMECSVCHEGYTGGSAVNLTLHINGTLDVDLSEAVGGTFADGTCSNVICHGGGESPNWMADVELNCASCHGGVDNTTGAPPADLSGNSVTSAKGVGAHTVHLTGGDLSNGMDCSECHLVPAATDEAGHIGAELLPAEITWGTLASMDDAEPSWDGATTCQNVYCHGEFAFGNQTNAPEWTKVDGSQAACGTCHGLPPASPHPDNSNCSLCHSSVVDASNTIIDKEKHINGQRDL